MQGDPHKVSNVRRNQHYRCSGEGVITMAWSYQKRLHDTGEMGTRWELLLEI